MPLAHVKFNAVAPDFSEAGMRVLAAAPLRALHLRSETLGDADLAPLAGHPTLADLEIDQVRLTASGARTLGSLPRLRRLDLSRSTLDDLGARELAPLAGMLRSLDLGVASAISDAACETLAAFEQLAFLDVSSTRVTTGGVRRLAGLRRLEHLDLGDLDLDDDAVLALAPLAKLRSLSLCDSRRITDRTVDALAQLTALERLDLGGTQLTARGIERLAELPRLQELGLRGCDDGAIERASAFDHWYVDTRHGVDIDDDLPVM
jgi:Leucine-rich repeat (LRR) protein